ncbi:MAG TPA: hypothetical protein VGO45_12115, partial [Bacteroidia bacterium]|nr:hypothetical protein [Bacteroidia bacterium]
MNLKIVTELPFWFIVFCLAAGLAYAFFLYYREKRFSDTPGWLKWTMTALRFVSVSAIAFLLLNPLLKTIFREVEKPVIVIAQDNSRSIVIGKDSSYMRGEYKKQLAKLADELSDKFELRFYTFGEKLKEIPVPDASHDEIDFGDKETDMSSFFEEMETRYSNRNLGAVIFASDGLFNKGLNPVFSSSRLKAPLFTVALGDTNVRKDLILSKVIHNRLAYLGDKFQMEVVVNARQCKGMTSMLTVRKGENTLFSQRIDISTENYNRTIPLELEARESGLQRYHIRLSPVKGELSLVNNAQDVFVEVLDGRQKILILADAPHPDVAALKLAIENNRNYEVDAFPVKDFDGKLNSYNLIILHQLPSRNTSPKLMNDVLHAETPLLFVVGNETNLPAFNSLQTGLLINGLGQRFNEPQPV